MNKKSSEEIFGINKQPADTCPDIDGLLESIQNIGDYDDDGDLIEVEPDFGSWSSAQDNVDELKNWQDEWINIGEQLIERLDLIKEAFKIIDNEKEPSSDQEMYDFLFRKEEDYIYELADNLFEHLNEWKKALKADFIDLEYQHSVVISCVDNNEAGSFTEVENYRSMVKGFRDNGNYFKELIRDNAEEYLPELCSDLTLDYIYDKKIEEIEKTKLLDTMKKMGLTKEEKNKKTIKRKI